MEKQPILSVVIPVFNDALQARVTVAAFAKQTVPVPVELILVDDGSSPPISVYPPTKSKLNFQLIRLEENQGRAGALNAGIRRSKGAYITFLDVDCVPQEKFLSMLLGSISLDFSLIFGHINFASGDVFFDSYENRIQGQRRVSGRAWATTLTSANVTIRRDLVAAVGGFDQAYRHYGFEDRDFFLRLEQVSPQLLPTYNDDVIVDHVDPPLLEGIISKFEQSGRHTAAMFADAHRDAYHAMPVFHFDVQRNKVYRFFPDWLINVVSGVLLRGVRGIFHLAHRFGLYSVAALSLKCVKGLAFLRGTLAAGRVDG